jgi:hypothetical protein
MTAKQSNPTNPFALFVRICFDVFKLPEWDEQLTNRLFDFARNEQDRFE